MTFYISTRIKRSCLGRAIIKFYIYVIVKSINTRLLLRKSRVDIDLNF
ncbi:hypothetical protein BMETH_1485_1 [methanotrophic bacterial endosymbiont of Bathymodiolus sp.]|nr:hypothetical protein BMETH_1485_1 [methanotrophic bacterial endosymbiont of Bathymodiolus sp.]